MQTYDFAGEQQQQWGQHNKMTLGVWEAIELLNEVGGWHRQLAGSRGPVGLATALQWAGCPPALQVVDDSDPDTSLPQIEHLLQTAEACRRAFPQAGGRHAGPTRTSVGCLGGARCLSGLPAGCSAQAGLQPLARAFAPGAGRRRLSHHRPCQRQPWQAAGSAPGLLPAALDARAASERAQRHLPRRTTGCT
jgi:hypothetical protein